jgi:glutaredoxin
MKKYLLLLMLLFFFLYGTANADFYKWEDENGATQITDYPPPQGNSAKDVQVHKYESDSLTELQKEEDKKKSSKDNKSQKPPDVVIYTKNDCKDCDKAREFLKSKNIPFTEYNMDNDKTSAARRKEVDDTEDVPFAIINKNQVYGFSESIYNKAMKSNP